jgi:putative ABC transport system permease protein
LLSILGGLVGLMVVLLAVPFLSNWMGFDIFMSAGNIINGIGISTVVGLISGTIPAIMAARLDPVEAIRSGI